MKTFKYSFVIIFIHRAMDDPIETGGSFDGTGAFLGPDDRNLGNKSNKTVDNQQIQKNDLRSNRANNDNTIDDDIGSSDSPQNTSISESEEMVKTKSDDSPLSDLSDRLESNEHIAKEQMPNQSDEQRINDEIITESEQNIIGEKSIQSIADKFNSIVSTTTDRMQEVAEDIEKLIMDDDQTCNDNENPLIAVHLHRDPHKIPNTDDVLVDKKKEKDSSDLWYYRDPQGKVQGPFTATEMLEWYRAGYFDDTLNVRRVCDPQFLELGELLKACNGTIPFVGMPIIQPILQNSKSDINLSPAVQSTTPTKPLNHLVHNTNKIPPQSTNNPNYYDILQSQPFMNLDYGE